VTKAVKLVPFHKRGAAVLNPFVTAWRAKVLAALAVLIPSVSLAQSLTLGGTGGAIPMLREAGRIFAAKEGIELNVIDSLGSGGGIAAARDGVLDVAASGRELTKEEAAAGLSVSEVLRTPYVIATSYATPPSFSRAEIGKLFVDQGAKWPDGTPVRLVLRPPSESDNAVLFNLFPGSEAGVVAARLRQDVPVAPTDQDNQAIATRIPGSLIGTTYTQLLLEHRALHALPIDGIAPTAANLANGSYPYEKRILFISPAKQSPTGKKFIEFLRSPEGQTILNRCGLLPA
jgi:phosphate transport system substrate-binding protein